MISDEDIDYITHNIRKLLTDKEILNLKKKMNKREPILDKNVRLLTWNKSSINVVEFGRLAIISQKKKIPASLLNHMLDCKYIKKDTIAITTHDKLVIYDIEKQLIISSINNGLELLYDKIRDQLIVVSNKDVSKYDFKSGKWKGNVIEKETYIYPIRILKIDNTDNIIIFTMTTTATLFIYNYNLDTDKSIKVNNPHIDVNSIQYAHYYPDEDRILLVINAGGKSNILLFDRDGKYLNTYTFMSGLTISSKTLVVKYWDAIGYYSISFGEKIELKTIKIELSQNSIEHKDNVNLLDENNIVISDKKSIRIHKVHNVTNNEDIEYEIKKNDRMIDPVTSRKLIVLSPKEFLLQIDERRYLYYRIQGREIIPGDKVLLTNYSIMPPSDKYKKYAKKVLESTWLSKNIRNVIINFI